MGVWMHVQFKLISFKTRIQTLPYTVSRFTNSEYSPVFFFFFKFSFREKSGFISKCNRAEISIFIQVIWHIHCVHNNTRHSLHGKPKFCIIRVHFPSSLLDYGPTTCSENKTPIMVPIKSIRHHHVHSHLQFKHLSIFRDLGIRKH